MHLFIKLLIIAQTIILIQITCNFKNNLKIRIKAKRILDNTVE